MFYERQMLEFWTRHQPASVSRTEGGRICVKLKLCIIRNSVSTERSLSPGVEGHAVSDGDLVRFKRRYSVDPRLAIAKPPIFH